MKDTNVTRRDFVTTMAIAGAGLTIVPRHVLGRGFTAPSDTVNIATVGINGQGATNTQAVMSQNIVAICDCDDALLDAKLQSWKTAVERAARPAAARPVRPAAPDARRHAGAAHQRVQGFRTVQSADRGRRQVGAGPAGRAHQAL